jgi:hypothetical protein
MIDRIAGFWQVVDVDNRANGKPVNNPYAIKTKLFSQSPPNGLESQYSHF